MNYSTQQITMSDGGINVFHSWLPDGEVKGIVLLSHGMTEHASRYERLGRLLTEKGVALYAEDHRGHGETARLAEENGTGMFGYLADRDGFFRVVDDIHEELVMVKNLHPGKKIVLFGHSFGSFISQCFLEKYGESLDGCILCGTAGPRYGLVESARAVGNIIKFFTGRKHVSPLMDKLAFGSYNSRIKDRRTNFDWLSRDNAQVDKYIEDPWCGYVCTIGFFCDMFAGLSYIHRKENMAKVPKNLPVHFIDGTGDPVGDYAESVKNLCEIYRSNGVKNADIKLFEDARHELLNETNREEVEADVLAWVEGIFAA